MALSAERCFGMVDWRPRPLGPRRVIAERHLPPDRPLKPGAPPGRPAAAPHSRRTRHHASPGAGRGGRGAGFAQAGFGEPGLHLSPGRHSNLGIRPSRDLWMTALNE